MSYHVVAHKSWGGGTLTYSSLHCVFKDKFLCYFARVVGWHHSARWSLHREHNILGVKKKVCVCKFTLVITFRLRIMCVHDIPLEQPLGMRSL